MNLREMNKDMLIKIIETIEVKHEKELEEKDKIIKLFGIRKCNMCEAYSNDHVKCENCSRICCDDCAIYSRFSGITYCKKCFKNHRVD